MIGVCSQIQQMRMTKKHIVWWNMASSGSLLSFGLQINGPKGVIVWVSNIEFSLRTKMTNIAIQQILSIISRDKYIISIPTSSCRWLWPRWPDGEIHEIGGTFKLDPFSALKISSTLEAVTSYVYSTSRIRVNVKGGWNGLTSMDYRMVLMSL